MTESPRSFATVLVGLAVVLLVAAPAPAAAEEVKTPVGALLLDILATPTRPVSAFDQSLKDPGPPPREPVGVVEGEGTVRYGNVTVTVKQPCPPGTVHYEPPPLPGRRARP